MNARKWCLGRIAVLKRWHWVSVLLAAAILVLAIGFSTWRRSQSLYRVTILPSLGGRKTLPHAINDRGQVVGYSQTAGGAMHLFCWDRAGGIQDLGVSSGTQLGTGSVDINNAGWISGSSRAPNGHRQAFVRDPNGTFHWLGTLGGRWSEAVALNDCGQVIGTSEAADGSRCAFVWDQAQGMRNILTFSGQNDHVEAINEAGWVFGYVDMPSRPYQPFLRDPNEGLVDLSAILSNGDVHACHPHSYLFVTARRSLREGYCAFLWSRPAGYTKLWLIERDIDGPVFVNDVNQVACWEETLSTWERITRRPQYSYRPIVWDPIQGRIPLDPYLPWRLRKTLDLRDPK